MGTTDNVAELMAGKISSLPSNARKALIFAACIGNRFDLKILAPLCEISIKTCLEILARPISQGLLLPISDIYKSVELDIHMPDQTLPVEFAFCHDRIQKAACVCGQYPLMKALGSTVHEHAGVFLDRIRVYEAEFQALKARKKNHDVVRASLLVLKRLSIRLPKRSNKLRILLSLMRAKLALMGKRPENLHALPEMTDPEKKGRASDPSDRRVCRLQVRSGHAPPLCI